MDDSDDMRCRAPCIRIVPLVVLSPVTYAAEIAISGDGGGGGSGLAAAGAFAGVLGAALTGGFFGACLGACANAGAAAIATNSGSATTASNGFMVSSGRVGASDCAAACRAASSLSYAHDCAPVPAPERTA